MKNKKYIKSFLKYYLFALQVLRAYYKTILFNICIFLFIHTIEQILFDSNIYDADILIGLICFGIDFDV